VPGAALVEARTQLVNTARGLVKGFGYRLPDCTTAAFSNKALAQLPSMLLDQLIPLLSVIEGLNREIQSYDKAVELLARQRYPETAYLQQVNGVGPLTALTFVLTVGDTDRFAASRDVGCYVGLRPRHSQSGEYDPELGITKAGDTYLRKLLVQCSHHVLGQWGQDSAIKRWGLKLVQKGGKNAKKRAVVAVARKLSVLLHKLWSTKAVYEPFFGMKALASA
jgi:transposase